MRERETQREIDRERERGRQKERGKESFTAFYVERKRKIL